MTESVKTCCDLALLGGPALIPGANRDIFRWPIVTEEHEQAVVDVLRRGAMSGLDVTSKFEEEYAQAMGRKHGLGFSSGTAAIQTALYALGVGVGHEVICPAMTYWASVLQVYSLGATPVFADIDPYSLCIDPNDIEKRITPRTKAIVIVHYAGMPCDMDAILPVAAKHNIPVMEDVSHAHGTLYKGKEAGTFSEVAAMSLMSGKSFAIGEAGILVTDDRRIYEKSVLFGHYAQHGKIEEEDFKAVSGLPHGGYKYRMHQCSSAFGRVQLKHYPAQMAEIDKAMNRFCDLLEGTPGLEAIRPPKGENSTRGGWYSATMLYKPEELGGLSNVRFAEACRAEGTDIHPGVNTPLHTHPLFHTVDVYGHGKPTRIANLPEGVDVRQPAGSLPVAEAICTRTITIPWFKHDRPEVIERHADAVKKVVANHEALLPEDTDTPAAGEWSASAKMVRK